MQKKKLAAVSLAVSMILTSSGLGTVTAFGQEDGAAEKYVTLDGDWHFKLYRTYSQMFQYFPYGGVSVTWEDNELAKLPSEDVWSSWEVVQMPTDDAATGGLLQIDRPEAAVSAEEDAEAAEESETAEPVEEAEAAEPVEEAEPSEEAEAAEPVEEAETAEPVEEAETAEPVEEAEAAEEAEESQEEAEAAEPIEEAEPAEEAEESREEAEAAEPVEEAETAESVEEAEPAEEAAESREEAEAAEPVEEAETAEEAEAAEEETEPSEEETEEPAAPVDKLFPSWSEAWVCREFSLPADFTEDEEVTLLLGIIDDMDVVYINGHLVAASGFMDGNGVSTQNIPETGGFDYENADPAAQVQFEKSCWEISREYKVPAEYLNQGGTNEICIRIYNNNSYGGFYSGNNYAICGNDLAVRAVKGLPTETVSSEDLLSLVDKQIQAVEEEDPEAFAETIYDNYHNDSMDKEGRVEEVQNLMDAYDNLKIQDSNVMVYNGGENLYWYSAHRVITGTGSDGAEAVISEEDIEVCYLSENGRMYERGNWSRCYSVTYDSGLFEKELGYSVYLPPSYYEDESREYPSVYLLHGINSSSESFVKVDGIAGFMDEQIAQGNITEMIVIMPDSGKNSFYRDTEYDPANADSTGPWQTHITTEIREEAESHYRIISDAKFRGLTGISMGGFGAFTIGTLYPELYSSVASHMGAVNDEALEALKTLTPEQLEAYDFYLDCGLQDGMVDYQWTVNIHNYLDSMGKEHGYDLRDGGHNSAFYMAGMPASMKMHSDHFLKNGLLDQEDPVQTPTPEPTDAPGGNSGQQGDEGKKPVTSTPVAEKPAPGRPVDAADTGDSSQSAVYTGIFVGAAAVLAVLGVTVYIRKRAK